MVKVMVSQGSRAWANNLNDLRERWELRREEPVKFKVPVNLFKVDVKRIERKNLLKLQTDLISLLNDAKKEMRIHHDRRFKKGIYLPADKFNDLQGTINSIATHIQEVNHALSETKPKFSMPQIFMKICERELPRDLFDSISEEAYKKYKSMEGGKDDT